MAAITFNPKRTITKAFKVTPEESKRIELLAAAAGVSQKQYILTKLEDEEFIILPDIRTYKMIRNEMRLSTKSFAAYAIARKWMT